MNTVSWQNCYRILKEQASEFFATHKSSNIVPSEIQQKEIESLKGTIDYEKFFFITDTLLLQTENVFGTTKWLGWKENEFTIKKYYSIIHPTFLAAHFTGISELMKYNTSGKWPVSFMSPRLAISIALQHANGQYFLFKMYSLPFQYDQESRITSYLSEYTLIGPYSKDAFRGRLSGSDEINPEWQRNLLHLISQSFKNKRVFSPQEFRVLGKYADKPALTNDKAAEIFGVKESTIITHNRRIIIKAENYFQRKFSSIKEVAGFLREYRLI